MFHNNDIHTIEELIDWCLKYQHEGIGHSLQDVVLNRPSRESSIGIKGGGGSGNVLLLDLLFSEQYHAELLLVANTYLTFCDILNIHPPRAAPQQEATTTTKHQMGMASRHQLAMMISHFYALSF